MKSLSWMTTHTIGAQLIVVVEEGQAKDDGLKKEQNACPMNASLFLSS